MMNKNGANGNRKLALEIHGLTKSYGNVQALRGIDLEVWEGEIFGFLGPNGAGKTTTIRCLLDNIRPDSGKVRILGIDPQSDPMGVQMQTGYLPGEVQFYDNWTVEHQLRFFSDLRGNQSGWAFARQLAERLSLDLNKRLKNLSKGNKQKVAVIQALMHRPKFLMLDEPTGGLDPLMQREVLTLLREANAGGATVFFSSHIMSEVENVAGRVAIIREGQVVEVARTELITGRRINRVRVQFKQPVDTAALEHLSGIDVLDCPDENSIVLQVAGDMELLVKALSGYPVYDLETNRPSLEEAFLTYYKS